MPLSGRTARALPLLVGLALLAGCGFVPMDPAGRRLALQVQGDEVTVVVAPCKDFAITSVHVTDARTGTVLWDVRWPTASLQEVRLGDETQFREARVHLAPSWRRSEQIDVQVGSDGEHDDGGWADAFSPARLGAGLNGASDFGYRTITRAELARKGCSTR
ncbi:hypothetical protein EV189_4005 [Motilibacter rhizosphaerae]|uniref:Lipoprotein n=1 Tax=Motilibacter rhizosphaerae TaxID=598652 RepID=A0A4Q7N780_9ACTN|nr:hypothetical protein [Motilibacter rhizosphaerae]RZS77570.1 hypothetical protein EV189_4005 [Motilibacter rhizosphaerae]